MLRTARYTTLAILAGTCLLPPLSAAQAQDQPVRLTAAISLEKKVVTQHEPVIIDIAFDNPSLRGTVVNLGRGDGKLDVKVVGPGEEVARKPRPTLNEGWGSADIFYIAAASSSTGAVALNLWFDFDKTGAYRIDVTVSPNSSPKEPFSYTILNNSASLELTVLPEDRPSLESACTDLIKRVEGSNSASTAIVAAEALSRIDDPAVVPYLAEAMKRREFTSLMIAALARLNTDDAVNALVLASRSSDPETRTLAHSALVGLGKAKEP
jgi:hypothetical protein